MNQQKTVAVYYRVSSNKQTTECQKPDVERLLNARGLTSAIVYEEQASAVKKRPQFDKMLADAQERKFDTLVIWSLDRFGRSMGGNVRDLLALDQCGVTVISAKEQWMDTAGPIRDLLIAIFSWVAQQERARLIERTNAGIARAKILGKSWGRKSRNLLPESLRGPVIAQWEEEGKPDGYNGLCAVLGCTSTATAWKLHKKWVSQKSAIKK
jgi:DNA invertase Pin-like site-specific DNA recombinase